MTTISPHTAPVRIARLTGILLVAMAIAAFFSELYVRGSLMVPGDAATTISNILDAPTLLSYGLIGYLVVFLLDVPVAVLFFVLFRHVNRTVSLTAMGFRLVYTAVVAAALLGYLGAVLPLTGGE